MLLADIIASSPFPRRTSAGKLDPADTKRFGFLGFGEIGAEAMLGRLSRPRCHGLLLGLGLRHLRSPVASEGAGDGASSTLLCHPVSGGCLSKPVLRWRDVTKPATLSSIEMLPCWQQFL